MTEHAEEHEATPGVDGLTMMYCGVFFALYLFYFWMVWIRWQVS